MDTNEYRSALARIRDRIREIPADDPQGALDRLAIQQLAVVRVLAKAGRITEPEEGLELHAWQDLLDVLAAGHPELVPVNRLGSQRVPLVGEGREFHLIRPEDVPKFIDYSRDVVEVLMAESDPTPAARTSDNEEPPALTECETRVLEALGTFHQMQLATIPKVVAAVQEYGPNISERTVGEAINRLCALVLAERPLGEKKGARLTTAGRRLLPKIAG
jgi:RIO-like serine/threonine protein kinase